MEEIKKIDIMQAMRERHSVRSYLDKKIEQPLLSLLQDEVAACNRESGLHIQLIVNEPSAFSNLVARYGRFRGVQNYIALVGKNNTALDEKCGYYGERLVLLAQQLGLNSCWVGASYSKGAAKRSINIAEGEKLCCVISLGYGAEQGQSHKNRALSSLCQVDPPIPNWFKQGMDAVLLAPTAMNQQRFMFIAKDHQVLAKSTGVVYSHVDLGIAKYHFELGAGLENFSWV